MMISAGVKYFRGDVPLTRQNDEMEKGSVGDSLKGAIPLRYRDVLGGVDIEQVKRDQRRARRQVLAAMIRGLTQLRPRR